MSRDIGKALSLAGAITLFAPSALAQTTPDPFGIRPALRTTWDSNMLRISPSRLPGNREDWRLTPGVDVDLARLIGGRHRLTVRGSLGYDFHRRFKFLDRERIELTTALDAVVAGTCHVRPEVRLNWAQANLSDQSDIIGNSQRQTDYVLSADCRRTAGLFPVANGRITRVGNSADPRRIFNLRNEFAQVGVGYAVPSIGDLAALVSYERFDRPVLRRERGLDDRVMVYRYGLQYRRAVAPRVSFELGADYMNVDPRRANWPGYNGVGFNAGVQYRPSPALTADLQATRTVTNQSNTGSTYILDSIVRMTVALDTSARGRLQAGAQMRRRSFRGENPIDLPFPRGVDRTWSLSTGYNHDLTRIFRVGLASRYERRTAPLDFFEYSSTSVTANLAARF